MNEQNQQQTLNNTEALDTPQNLLAGQSSSGNFVLEVDPNFRR